MKRKICIVHVNGYFGQSLPTETGLNMKEISSELKKMGLIVSSVELQCLVNGEIEPDSIYVFGSHQNPDIKKYIDDFVSVQSIVSNIETIPRPELILCHENKGVQAILSKTFSDDILKQQYIITDSNLECLGSSVYKSVSGSGSSGVFTASNEKELTKKIKNSHVRVLNINNLILTLKYRLRKIFKLHNELHYSYFRKYYRLVHQKLMSSPGFDFKVLVFGSSVYVLKRYAKKGDFRSSGSGEFEFPEHVESSLLDYAMKLKGVIATPYVSLDIMETDRGVYKCIEFQCLHFGPYTQYEAAYVYERRDQSVWVKVDNAQTMETLMASSIVEYMDEKFG